MSPTTTKTKPSTVPLTKPSVAPEPDENPFDPSKLCPSQTEHIGA